MIKPLSDAEKGSIFRRLSKARHDNLTRCRYRELIVDEARKFEQRVCAILQVLRDGRGSPPPAWTRA